MVYASNSMSSKSLSSSDDELHVSVSLSVGGGTLGITVIHTHRTVSRHLKLCLAHGVGRNIHLITKCGQGLDSFI